MSGHTHTHTHTTTTITRCAHAHRGLIIVYSQAYIIGYVAASYIIMLYCLVYSFKIFC